MSSCCFPRRRSRLLNFSCHCSGACQIKSSGVSVPSSSISVGSSTTLRTDCSLLPASLRSCWPPRHWPGRSTELRLALRTGIAERIGDRRPDPTLRSALDFAKRKMQTPRTRCIGCWELFSRRMQQASCLCWSHKRATSVCGGRSLPLRGSFFIYCFFGLLFVCLLCPVDQQGWGGFRACARISKKDPQQTQGQHERLRGGLVGGHLEINGRSRRRRAHRNRT